MWYNNINMTIIGYIVTFAILVLGSLGYVYMYSRRSATDIEMNDNEDARKGNEDEALDDIRAVSLDESIHNEEIAIDTGTRTNVQKDICLLLTNESKTSHDSVSITLSMPDYKSHAEPSCGESKVEDCLVNQENCIEASKTSSSLEEPQSSPSEKLEFDLLDSETSKIVLAQGTSPITSNYSFAVSDHEKETEIISAAPSKMISSDATTCIYVPLESSSTLQAVLSSDGADTLNVDPLKYVHPDPIDDLPKQCIPISEIESHEKPPYIEKSRNSESLPSYSQNDEDNDNEDSLTNNKPGFLSENCLKYQQKSNDAISCENFSENTNNSSDVEPFNTYHENQPDNSAIWHDTKDRKHEGKTPDKQHIFMNEMYPTEESLSSKIGTFNNQTSTIFTEAQAVSSEFCSDVPILSSDNTLVNDKPDHLPQKLLEVQVKPVDSFLNECSSEYDINDSAIQPSTKDDNCKGLSHELASNNGDDKSQITSSILSDDYLKTQNQTLDNHSSDLNCIIEKSNIPDTHDKEAIDKSEAITSNEQPTNSGYTENDTHEYITATNVEKNALDKLSTTGINNKSLISLDTPQTEILKEKTINNENPIDLRPITDQVEANTTLESEVTSLDKKPTKDNMQSSIVSKSVTKCKDDINLNNSDKETKTKKADVIYKYQLCLNPEFTQKYYELDAEKFRHPSTFILFLMLFENLYVEILKIKCISNELNELVNEKIFDSDDRFCIQVAYVALQKFLRYYKVAVNFKNSKCYDKSSKDHVTSAIDVIAEWNEYLLDPLNGVSAFIENENITASNKLRDKQRKHGDNDISNQPRKLSKEEKFQSDKKEFTYMDQFNTLDIIKNFFTFYVIAISNDTNNVNHNLHNIFPYYIVDENNENNMKKDKCRTVFKPFFDIEFNGKNLKCFNDVMEICESSTYTKGINGQNKKVTGRNIIYNTGAYVIMIVKRSEECKYGREQKQLNGNTVDTSYEPFPLHGEYKQQHFELQAALAQANVSLDHKPSKYASSFYFIDKTKIQLFTNKGLIKKDKQESYDYIQRTGSIYVYKITDATEFNE